MQIRYYQQICTSHHWTIQTFAFSIICCKQYRSQTLASLLMPSYYCATSRCDSLYICRACSTRPARFTSTTPQQGTLQLALLHNRIPHPLIALHHMYMHTSLHYSRALRIVLLLHYTLALWLHSRRVAASYSGYTVKLLKHIMLLQKQTSKTRITFTKTSKHRPLLKHILSPSSPLTYRRAVYSTQQILLASLISFLVWMATSIIRVRELNYRSRLTTTRNPLYSGHEQLNTAWAPVWNTYDQWVARASAILNAARQLD